MKAFTSDIHELSLGIVNVWLIRDGDGWVLIDTGAPNSAGEILNAAAILGFPPEQLRPGRSPMSGRGNSGRGNGRSSFIGAWKARCGIAARRHPPTWRPWLACG